MDAGSTETDVYFMGFPIWVEEGDLCSSTACPVRSGPVTLTFHRDFPAITPPVRSSSLTVQRHHYLRCHCRATTRCRSTSNRQLAPLNLCASRLTLRWFPLRTDWLVSPRIIGLLCVLITSCRRHFTSLTVTSYLDHRLALHYPRGIFDPPRHHQLPAGGPCSSMIQLHTKKGQKKQEAV